MGSCILLNSDDFITVNIFGKEQEIRVISTGDNQFDEVYPDESPEHFDTLLPSRAIFGGDEYLDGYSI